MDTPSGKKAQAVTDAAHRVGVEIDLSELGQRLQNEAMRLISDLTQQGFTGEALAERVGAGLMALSDRPIEEAARGAASEAFNLGRNLGAQSAQQSTEALIERIASAIERGNPLNNYGLRVVDYSPQVGSILDPSRDFPRDFDPSGELLDGTSTFGINANRFDPELLREEVKKALARATGYSGGDNDRVIVVGSNAGASDGQDPGELVIRDAKVLDVADAKAASDQIQQVVRSEVLDQNTCDPCAQVDGTIVEMNTPEYFRLMPPNLCSGRDLCRGFYVYLSEAA